MKPNPENERNPMPTEYTFDTFRDFLKGSGLEDETISDVDHRRHVDLQIQAATDLIKEYNIRCEKFTKEQIVDLLNQMLNSGDIERWVTVDSRQKVVYLPGIMKMKMEAKVESLETMIAQLRRELAEARTPILSIAGEEARELGDWLTSIIERATTSFYLSQSEEEQSIIAHDRTMLERMQHILSQASLNISPL
jgi:hypothetical protein